jgi:hypothetical protein
MSKEHLNQSWKRLVKAYPKVNTKCVTLKFKGVSTPAAYALTLVEIAFLCPGKGAAQFRRLGAEVLCRPSRCFAQ